MAVSTSIAACAADGDLGKAARSTAASIATCVANGVVVGAVAVTWVDGRPGSVAGEVGAAPACV